MTVYYVLTVYYDTIPVNITIDSGATTSFITEKVCNELKIEMKPTGKLIRLGDGCTTLAAIGEIDTTFHREKWTVVFRAIVVKTLSSDIYGGMTFLIDNDISLRPKTGEIKIHNKFVIYQTNTMMLPPQIRAMEKVQQTFKIPKGKIFPNFSSLCKQDDDFYKDFKNLFSATIELPDELKNFICRSYFGFSNIGFLLSFSVF